MVRCRLLTTSVCHLVRLLTAADYNIEAVEVLGTLFPGSK